MTFLALAKQTRLSQAQAFAKVYQDPANARLAERERARKVTSLRRRRLGLQRGNNNQLTIGIFFGEFHRRAEERNSPGNTLIKIEIKKGFASPGLSKSDFEPDGPSPSKRLES